MKFLKVCSKVVEGWGVKWQVGGEGVRWWAGGFTCCCSRQNVEDMKVGGRGQEEEEEEAGCSGRRGGGVIAGVISGVRWLELGGGEGAEESGCPEWGRRKRRRW